MRLFPMQRKNHLVSFMFRHASRKGSALLIVLGFLSFMMISGVSFAIYMRIERQAASNYRHSVTSRHLITAGLSRAMEEVDSELRTKRNASARWLGNVPVNSVNASEFVHGKFPAWRDWPGRVKVSATSDSAANREDARVLSLEALSFLPGVLLNDVLRFSQRQESSDPEYMGAKWRPLAQTMNETVNGRYAYVCVNVSDMLDVNHFRAALPRNTSANRASLGHLFKNEKLEDREVFDEDAAADRLYLSLQDFYAARYGRAKKEGGAGSVMSAAEASPYHAYINLGEPGFNSFKSAEAQRHAFITDSFAKVEPPRRHKLQSKQDNLQDACNIYLADEQPFDLSVLNTERFSDRNGFLFKQTSGKKLFWESLKLVAGNDSATPTESIWFAMLKDYLDKDGIVTDLGAPCVEMAPMISQVVMNPNLIYPELLVEMESWTKPGGGNPVLSRPTAKLKLINKTYDDANAFTVDVEIVFPFKYFAKNLRREGFPFPSFKMKGKWVFGFVNEKTATVSAGTLKPPLFPLDGNSENQYIWESAEEPITFPSAETEENDLANGNVDGVCYRNVTLRFKRVSSLNQNEVKLLSVNQSDGNPKYNALHSTGDAEDGMDYSVFSAFVIDIYDGNRLRPVDRVPCEADVDNSNEQTVDQLWRMSPKLYFKTRKISEFVSAPNLAAVPPGTYRLDYKDWNSLEIPDPRFNHRAANWVASQVGGATPAVDRKMNATTKELLGKDGRDRDIFMSVSNAGYMQSPGELGFIIRPFAYKIPLTGDVDFNVQTSLDALAANQDSDYDGMFRTYRLYDHGGNGVDQRRDFIYNNFFAANADGSLPGARVNPLSDLWGLSSDRPTVLEGAIIDTPLDYFFTSTNYPTSSTELNNDRATLDRRLFNNYPQMSTHWANFVKKWGQLLDTAVHTEVISNSQDGNGNVVNNRKFRVDKEWHSNLSDVYGEWNVFRWYDAMDSSTPPLQKTIFDNIALNNPLHEIDRKMLYAFSLDSFSDRQQLFLYFIRAEVTMPVLGSGAESGAHSLAGGRAVALVWRDPYPRNYNKISAIGNWNNQNGTHWESALNPWYPDLNNFRSPWTQYYTSGSSDSRGRWDSWHDSRVIFFKQLDK